MSENTQVPVGDETQLSDSTHLPSQTSDGHATTSLPSQQPLPRQSQPPHHSQLPQQPEPPQQAQPPQQAEPSLQPKPPQQAQPPQQAGSTQVPEPPQPNITVPPLPTPVPDETPAPGIEVPTDPGIEHFQRSFNSLVDNMSKAVVDKVQPIKLCVTALMVGGHVLLEDYPGTGKTQLARALAHSIHTTFKRIQFTPDLLPSDVVGVTFYDQKTGEFEFRPGPVFTSILLADEINRASPKTQSALLEVMEEQHVTVDGQTRDVPQPFVVIATQNPIEQLGTYKLPEAQMDRFLIKTSIGYPRHETSVNLLRQVNVHDRADTIEPVISSEEILELRKTAEKVHVDDNILEYIVRLVEATRHSEQLALGASMRGALALTRCARVWAAADGRSYVIPDDVKDLAIAVLTHRVSATAEAVFAGETCEQILRRLVEEVPAPTTGAE